MDRWHAQSYASRMTDLELKKYKPYLNQSKTESFKGLKQNYIDHVKSFSGITNAIYSTAGFTYKSLAPPVNLTTSASELK